MIDGLKTEILDLARTQTRARFEGTAAPLHDEAVRLCKATSREQLVNEAIDSLTPPDNVTTARILFGSHPKRWELALGERRKLAGRTVGFNPETFRKKNSEGVSDYGLLAKSLAAAIVQLASAAGDPTPIDIARAPSRRWRRPAVLLLLVGLVIAAGVATTKIVGQSETIDQVAGKTATRTPEISTRTVQPATPSPTLTDRPIPAATEGCNIPVGGALNPGAIVATAVRDINDEFVRMGGTAIVGCPADAAARWQDFWIQTFLGTPELPPGSIVSRTDMPQALWIEQSLVETYRRTAGSQLPDIDGVPISYEGSDTNPTVYLASGGLIVAHQAGGPAFWVPVEAIEEWGGPDGEFGLPMTDVNYLNSALTQQYERGQMAVIAEDQLEKFIPTSTDVEIELEQLDMSPPPGIMRTFDTTAWWIDEQGQRRWIPSVEVWECVGGDSAVIAQEIPGWIIGMNYPLGPTMTCDDVGSN